MLHYIISFKNKNIRKIWLEVRSFIDMKDLLLTWKTEICSCRSSFRSSFYDWKFMGCYKFLVKIILKIDFLKILHWICCSKNMNFWSFWQEVETEIGQYRRLLSPSFLNWEIIRPYKLLFKINWYIAFLKMLQAVICS